MNYPSEVFSHRIKQQHIGGIRFYSTSLPSNNQSPKMNKPFHLSKNTFKNKDKFSHFNEKIIFPPSKLSVTTQNSSSISPRGKNLRTGSFKLYNSKNVCVFENLKQFDGKEQFQLIKKKLQKKRLKLIDYQQKTKDNIVCESLSPRLKKIKNIQLSKTSSCSFQLRKVSSSHSCRQNNIVDQKIPDPWHIENQGEDSDILFYK